MHRGMYGLTIYRIFILVHNNDNWAILQIIQSTDGSNENWINLMIIDASNVEIPVWGYNDDSNII